MSAIALAWKSNPRETQADGEQCLGPIGMSTTYAGPRTLPPNMRAFLHNNTSDIYKHVESVDSSGQLATAALRTGVLFPISHHSIDTARANGCFDR